jgi:hypothetical protein
VRRDGRSRRDGVPVRGRRAGFSGSFARARTPDSGALSGLPGRPGRPNASPQRDRHPAAEPDAALSNGPLRPASDLDPVPRIVSSDGRRAYAAWQPDSRMSRAAWRRRESCTKRGKRYSG